MSLRWIQLLPIAAVLAVVTGCSKAPAGAGSAGPGRGGLGEKQVVEVTPVTRRDLIDTLTVVGSFAANESAEIRPEITGIVREILFEEGQLVKKGDVLLKIDDRELRAQYAQVEARYRLAELNVARSESLSETKTISQSESDRTRSEFAAVKAELELLRTRLDKTAVTAPFDGVVGGRAVSPGDYVTGQSLAQQTVITTIDDLSRLKVEFQVPEKYIEKVARGTTFRVRSSALGPDQDIRGEVYFVSPAIDRNTRSSQIKGLLDHPPPVLKPGMFATIELVLEVRKDALTVPEGSILVSSQGPQVIAVRGGEGSQVADFVPVKLGMRAKGLVEVSSHGDHALTENTPVVASGVGALILFPGAPLEPKPLREEFRLGP